MDAASPDAASLPFELAPVTVIVGQYGTGKTTLALNLAVDAARAGKPVVLVDLDIVNPYFRSTEYRALLEEAGVEVVAPVFAEAGSSLDVPSLTGAVVPACRRAHAHEALCIIDAGGDDAGATALGRFSRDIAAGPYDMLYVANVYRSFSGGVAEALGVLRDIERVSRLHATGIVSNAHLKADTDCRDVLRGEAFARELSRAAELPFTCATAPLSVVRRDSREEGELSGVSNLYPVNPYVTTPWERAARISS